MKPHLFSIEEANALIPVLEKLLTEIAHKKETHAQRHDEFLMQELLVKGTSHGTENAFESLDLDAQDLDEFMTEIHGALEKIRELGCLLRNLREGWVDFLSELKGEKVYLCWKRGEPRIRYYHPLQGGVMTRQPLD